MGAIQRQGSAHYGLQQRKPRGKRSASRAAHRHVQCFEPGMTASGRDNPRPWVLHKNSENIMQAIAPPGQEGWLRKSTKDAKHPLSRTRLGGSGNLFEHRTTTPAFGHPSCPSWPQGGAIASKLTSCAKPRT